MDASTFYGNRTRNDSSSEDELLLANESSDEDFILETESIDDSSIDENSEEENDTNFSQNSTQASTTSSIVVNASWKPVSTEEREFDFIGAERVRVDLPRSKDDKTWPIDIYKLFITDDLLDMISSATNEYAQQVIADRHVTRRSRLISWKDTTPEEILKFFGIILYMGLVDKPEIALYWSKSMLYDDPFVPKQMSRERFEQLWSFIHFSDNSAADSESNRLCKIQPLLEKLLHQFQGVYEPGPNLVLDESMIPFRGRLKFRQYLPGKAHKYGVKLYKLCTPEAYTWNVVIHHGATPSIHGLSSTESLTIKMCDKLLNEGRVLYADNYYSSVPLAEFLLTKKTYYCGTVRKNRKHLTTDVALAKLKKGEMKASENNSGVKFYNWRDKRNVFSISTVPEHGGDLVSTGKKNRKGEDVFKPPSILDYNKAKKGVDVSDQLSSYYSVLRKSKKWYRKIAFELIGGTSVVNAHILYQKYCNGGKMTLRKFTESLILSIFTGDPTEHIRCGKRKQSLNVSSSEIHTLGEADGPKRKSRKRCKGCYEKISINEGFKVAGNKARRVSTFCTACDGKPFYCLPCFNEKHAT